VKATNFRPARDQIARLRRAVGSKPGHANFPGLIVEAPEMCYGYTLAQSGGHQMLTDELPDGRKQLQFGLLDTATGQTRAGFAGAVFMTCGRDRNQVAINFQDFLRAGLVEKHNNDKARPVHYNCWEAIYFDHRNKERRRKGCAACPRESGG